MAKSRIKRQLNIYKPLSELLFLVAMFTVIGTLVPPLITMARPATTYISISSPATVDRKQYKAGDFTFLKAVRTSRTTGTGVSVQELVLIATNGERTEVHHDSYPIPLLIGDEDTAIRLKLPEDIDPGLYFWHGVLSFEVNGVHKNVPYNSVTFEVVE